MKDWSDKREKEYKLGTLFFKGAIICIVLGGLCFVCSTFIPMHLAAFLVLLGSIQ